MPSSLTLKICGQIGSEKFKRALQLARDDYHENIDNLTFWALEFDDDTVDSILGLLKDCQRQWNSVTFSYCALQMHRIVDALFKIGVPKLTILTRRSDSNTDVLRMLEALCVGMGESSCIETLNLRMGLCGPGATFLARGIAMSSSLKKLSFAYSLIQEDAVAPLAEGLRSNTRLQEISFERCDLSDSHLGHLINSLKLHPSLRKIGFDGKRCRSRSVRALAFLLESPTCKIAALDLSRDDLLANENNEDDQEHEALRELVLSLRSNSSLRSLSLSRRRLTDTVMADLASVLEHHNETLRFLDLSHCMISDKGLFLLSESLPGMKGLQKLWLGGRQSFGRPSVRNLVLNGLRDNTEIVDLILPLMEQSYFYKRFAYYSTLNGAGRRLLRLQSPPIPALWPLVLGRANRFVRFASQDTLRVYTSKEDILYYFLRNGPVLMEMGGL
jgi:hypothetical protein